MILLTANRSMKGEDSLEQVIREENTVDSFPVITIGDADRFLADRVYRNLCVDRILEIGVADLRYEKLNMQFIKTSVYKASGF